MTAISCGMEHTAAIEATRMAANVAEAERNRPVNVTDRAIG